MSTFLSLVAVGSGSIVGLVLGLVGSGGSILAVPLLVYVVGVASPHVAIGTSAVAVALSAALSLVVHARLGTVRWPCALVFAPAGIAGAILGAELGKAFDGQRLLALFGLLMLAVGLAMFRAPPAPASVTVRLTNATAAHIVPRLVVIGLVVGLLAGFFGIGGGFLIVPGLMLATGMAISNAVGTSLVAVTALGLTTSASYATSGLVDWRLAGLLIAGGAAGGFVGARLGSRLGAHRTALTRVFAVAVVATGLIVVGQGIGKWG